VNPEPFLQLDRVIHEKGRMAIMSLLAASPELSFTELRDTLAMTDGRKPGIWPSQNRTRTIGPSPRVR
jgi:hypothetical protein